MSGWVGGCKGGAVRFERGPVGLYEGGWGVPGAGGEEDGGLGG